MKAILFLFFATYSLCTVAQLSKSRQDKIDSLYGAAHNTLLTPDNRGSAYNRICWLVAYEDYNHGLKVSTEYLDFAKKHGLVDREIIASHFLGYAQLMLGKTEDAEKSYQRGLELSLKHNNIIKAAEAYADLGNLRYSIGDAKGAITFHHKCLKLAEKNGFTVNETRSHINIGEIYEAQGLYDRSLERFQKAKLLAEEYGFTGFYSSIYEHLGDVSMSINEYDIAQRHYRSSLSNAIKYPNKNRRVRALKKLGQLHQEQGQLDSALIYYDQALDFCIKNDVLAQLPSIRSNVAGVLFAQGNSELALEKIEQSLDDYEQYNVQEGLEEAFLIAGKIYFEVGQFSKSEQCFKSCYELALKSKKLITLKGTTLGLYQVYRRTGKPKLALRYYEEFNSFTDRLRGEEEIKEVLKMEIATDFKSRAISDSLEQLRKFEKMDFEHQRSEAKTKFNFYVSLSGVVLLSLALIFTAFILVQKRKSTRLLNLSNETIKQALKDKEILLKEVHHRVKNNMQVVSSLLYLKSKNMPNEIAKEAILDSKKRIDSMQLSHQRMYQNGNYEQIDIVGYSKDIFQVLLDPIRGELDRFEVKGEEQLIHVEQSQTLGYVIHEFIVNSIKHAWNDEKPKHVELSIERIHETIRVTYQDNGKGLPKDFDISSTKTFGMMVVNSLVSRQLQGSIKIGTSKGVRIIIEFEARPYEFEAIT